MECVKKKLFSEPSGWRIGLNASNPFSLAASVVDEAACFIEKFPER